MGVIWFILFGLIIGLIARAIYPGRQAMGLGLTAVLGCAGSLLGGVLGNLLFGTGRDAGSPTTAGFLGSLIGALALLGIASVVGKRGHRRAI